jgi:hypothetical protein
MITLHRREGLYLKTAVENKQLIEIDTTSG